MIVKNYKDILAHYNVAETAYIGSGMESQVYRLGCDCVLKIQPYKPNDLTSKQALMGFYSKLDSRGISFNLPQILSVEQMGEFGVIIERLIKGNAIKPMLPSINKDTAVSVMEHYLLSILELRRVMVGFSFKDTVATLLSGTGDGIADWNSLLLQLLLSKYQKNKTFFKHNVKNIVKKIDSLIEFFSKPYNGDYTLIHGDFCPENILMDDDSVTGVIDFGFCNTVGDYLYDVALGWAFADMYNLYSLDYKGILKKLIQKHLPDIEVNTLENYIRFYSVYSADFYSDSCSDGHANWCFGNLNRWDIY